MVVVMAVVVISVEGHRKTRAVSVVIIRGIVGFVVPISVIPAVMMVVPVIGVMVVVVVMSAVMVPIISLMAMMAASGNSHRAKCSHRDSGQTEKQFFHLILSFY